MIKLYLDWNVMSGMKQHQHDELHSIITHKHQFFIVYSTSHIIDLLVSNTGTKEQTAIIYEDLTYISDLTNNFCAHNQNKNIVIDQLDPTVLFEERIWENEQFNTEDLFELMLEGVEPNSDAFIVINNYMDMPIPSEVSQAFSNSVTVDYMRKHYPGLEENPTMRNLVNIGWKKLKNLTNTGEYEELRKTLQQSLGIKPNQMFEKAEPYKQIDRLYNKLYNSIPLPLSKIASAPVNDNSPEWFQNITNNYLSLDMHGYQEDKITFGKGRPQTMRNTIDDAFHAGFSSMCDFYITNDSKSRKKTMEVFKKLNLNTTVFSSQEFVSHYNACLVYDDIRVHIKLWFEILKNKDCIITQEAGGILRSYHLNYFIFDYFNRCYILSKEDYRVPIIFLSKEKPTNNKFIYRNELAELIKKLSLAFETNISTPNHIESDKIAEETWLDYHWDWAGLDFRLVLRNGYLQLYMDINETKFE